MSARQDRISTYIGQVRFRVAWFVLATLVGAIAALVVAYGTEIDYPAWRLGLLVHGVIFWPVFIWYTVSKRHVSTHDAWRARQRLGS